MDRQRATLARHNRAVVQQQRQAADGQPNSVGSILNPTRAFPNSDPNAAKLYAASATPKRHKPEKPLNEEGEWAKCRDRLVSRIGEGFLVALVGQRGTGKTQLAQQSVMAACGLRRPALYCRAMEIFLELRATYRTEGAAELTVINRFRDPLLLVIDEVQDRGETDWENRVLNHLIDCRYGDMKDTILIANLVPSALKDNLGPSVFDRLIETGGVIECKWESYRKPRA